MYIEAFLQQNVWSLKKEPICVFGTQSAGVYSLTKKKVRAPMRLAAQHTCLLHGVEVDSFPQAMARQARQAGRVLKCEPGTQSNNRAICPGNAHIHLTKDKPVWEQIKENKGVEREREGERERVRGGEERKQ